MAILVLVGMLLTGHVRFAWRTRRNKSATCHFSMATMAITCWARTSKQFIGTRKGFDRASEPVLDKKGEPLTVTRRYSKHIGEVLAEVKGTNPGYPLKGDEIYVRARITSSKLKANPYVKGEFERAWTQPLVTGRTATAGVAE